MRPAIRPILGLLFLAAGAQGAAAQSTPPVDKYKLLGVPSTTKDFFIPAEAVSVRLVAQGGAGGDAAVKKDGKCKTAGGAPALLRGTFAIGDGPGELAPGGVLRFIVGDQGGSVVDEESSGGHNATGAGGGGTGILYRAAAGDEWQPLLVAGGGGGAIQTATWGFCGDGKAGLPASLTTTGVDGAGDHPHWYGGAGGTNGQGGGAGVGWGDYGGGGGGGLYSAGGDAHEDPWTVYGGEKGMENGGFGGLGHNSFGDSADGGFGCGAGGGSGRYSGGGGGGYSGGGGGATGKDGFEKRPGGGGGSFVASEATSVTKTHAATSVAGLASFKFLSADPGNYCAEATEIPFVGPGGSYAISGNTSGFGASQEGSCNGWLPQVDRWYRFTNTLPCTRQMFVSGKAETPHKLEVLYEVTPDCGALDSFDCASIPSNTSGITSVPIAEGQSVLLRVVAEGFTGPYSLDLLFLDAFLDADGDSRPDCFDNCPSTWNPDQIDTDGDGFGDVCDLCPEGDNLIDTDGDGVPDGCDDCPGDNNLDTDGDGVPDDCDICLGDDTVDSDLDGIPDACDPCFGPAGDCNGNGLGDACDLAHLLGAARLESFNGTSAENYVLNTDALVLGPDFDLQALVLSDFATISPSVTSTIVFEPVSPHPISEFSAEFWFRMETALDGAGGMSFSIFEASTFDETTLFGASGPGAASLTVAFDIDESDASDLNDNHIELLVDGQSIAVATPSYDLDGNDWRRARVALRDAKLSLSLVDLFGAVEWVFDELPVP
ncbi:MAG: thrombospondin type 3 repeat-containing protein, partial [Planctomycetota bacterium]